MSIGQPLPRADGFAKVSGRAKYAADNHLSGQLHAVCVPATIPAGRVVSIDSSRARTQPGVVRVLAHSDMPRLRPAPVPPLSSAFLPMQSDEIRFEGQTIAIVLAESLEAAEEAARRVDIVYERSVFRAPGQGEPIAVEPGGYVFKEPELHKGDAEAGFARAAHRHEAVYTQPSRHHNPMEPSATLAVWEGDRLTVHDAVQNGYATQFVLSALFGVEAEKIRVLSPFVGGGFGIKGYIWPHQVLAAAAAKVAGRPVKLVLSRAGMYGIGYQPHIAQTITLGAEKDGRFTAIGHDVVNLSSVSETFVEFASAASEALYATPALRLSQRVEQAHVSVPTAMRAPVEGPGTWALESAVDEMAHRVGMDPLDFRLANYAEVDPVTGKPWSSKKLREAYEEGAELFGWRKRPARPHRDGNWIVGHGMASCVMGCFRFPAHATVRLSVDGSAVIESGFHEIGTGSLTVFPQIAAEILGIDPARIASRNGDTRLPQAAPTHGSTSVMGTGSAVRKAAEDIRAKLAGLANLPPDEAEMVDGRLRRRGGMGEGEPVADVMRRAGVQELLGEGRFALPGDALFEIDGSGGPYAIRTFGAVFVEVGVDPALGLLRLRRAVGSYSAGRIINPRTARAQMIGGLIWGWGMAAMEASHPEPDLGRWLNRNLAGVAVPVNADIPGDITIHFVDEFDPHASPLGAKGIGELGATGVAAAVANAVFAATGKRVRDLPITPDKLVA